MRHIKVVCAVVVYDGKILCMRRPLRGSASTAGKWEFPGGKIERGEKPEQALARELLEEMDYVVTVVKPLMTVKHNYHDFSLSLQTYLCQADTTEFNRKEHIDHCWLLPEELPSLDWAEADHEIIDTLSKGKF